jgi:hypothetical protein
VSDYSFEIENFWRYAMKKKHDVEALVHFMKDAEDNRDIFHALKRVLKARRIEILYTDEHGDESKFFAGDAYKDEKDEQWRQRKLKEFTHFLTCKRLHDEYAR